MRSLRLIDLAREVLRQEQGVAHVQRFLEAGLTREQVGHLKHLDVLRRPRIGWYSDPALPLPAFEAVRVGGVLGCVSAAATWGMATPEGHGSSVHVSLVAGSTRLRRSTDATERAFAGTDAHARWHWEHRQEPAAGWRVPPLDALLQMAACVEYRWLVAAIDSARCSTHRPALLDDAAVDRLRSLLPAHLKRAVADSDPLAEASGETMLRLGLQAAHVPVKTQVWMTERYRADLLVDGWLPVESDGMEHHSGAEAVERDRERDATLARLGAPLLRFSQKQAVRETAFVVDTVKAVWERGRFAPRAVPQFLPDTPPSVARRRRVAEELRNGEGIADP